MEDQNIEIYVLGWPWTKHALKLNKLLIINYWLLATDGEEILCNHPIFDYDNS